MAPTIGRIVIYTQPADEMQRNGCRTHPAIITRVWSEDCVNLTVFLDDGFVGHVTSVLKGSSYDAENRTQCASWEWPPRMPGAEPPPAGR